MEPIAPLVARTRDDGNAITKSDAQQRRAQAIAAAYQAQDAAERAIWLEQAAKAQAAIGRTRRSAALWIWMIATVIALLLCGWLGLRLLHAIGLTEAPVFIDLLVTGLAIGGGTKPLHDLISNIQKTKEQKEDPQETSQAAS